MPSVYPLGRTLDPFCSSPEFPNPMAANKRSTASLWILLGEQQETRAASTRPIKAPQVPRSCRHGGRGREPSGPLECGFEDTRGRCRLERVMRNFSVLGCSCSNILAVELALNPPQTVMLMEETSGTMWMKGMEDVPLVQKLILFSAGFSNMMLDHSECLIFWNLSFASFSDGSSR